jgi:Protein of unknown function, DUF547
MEHRASLNRRTLIMGGASALMLGGCVRSAKTIGGNWGVVGTGKARIDHDAWDRILTLYARRNDDGVNRFAYSAVSQADRAALKTYLKALQAVRPQDYARDEQFAYWVNLYNAATVDLIVDAYPVKSIRDLGFATSGPWRKKILMVNGERLSLDDVEHGILRPVWKDVRIHYAVNCASIGCPNLALKAYRAETLETMLEQAARDYINHARGFAMTNGQLTASSIFKWYQSDWGSEAGVLNHAQKYANPATAAFLNAAGSIDNYTYDWALNDAAD